jgi:hypothetical protein
LAVSKSVYIPPGVYNTLGTITIPLQGTRLFGAGRLTTEIVCYSTTAPAIEILTNLLYVEIEDMFIHRQAGSPTSTAHGIVVNYGCSQCQIRNITLENHGGWGLKLDEVSWGVIDNVGVQGCLAGGVQIKNSTTTLLQWELRDVGAILNGGPGFSIETVPGTGDITLGTFYGLTTYANTGHGIQFIGSSTAPLFGIRLYNSGFGSDSASEVYLDTYGRGHVLRNVSTELAGVLATGPTSTPATHVGHGFEFTANNIQIHASGLHGDNNSNNGLFSDAAYVTVSNSGFSNSGNALTAGLRAGMAFNSGTSVIATGNKCGNLQGSTNAQYGIVVGGYVADCVINDNDLSSNTVGPVAVTATGKISVYNNIGYNENNLTYDMAANTSLDGLTLFDGVAATSGNQQFSPRLKLSGQGWKTNATAGSQIVDWKIETQPIQGAASPDNSLIFGSQINGAGFTERVAFVDSPNGTQTELRLSHTGSTRIMLWANGVAQAAFYASTGQIIFGSVSNIILNFFSNNATRAYIPAAGGLVIGDGANTLATNATNGFLYIPRCAGAPTGTPVAQAGTVPMIYDSTNNKFYIYNGAWRGVTLA